MKKDRPLASSFAKSDGKIALLEETASVSKRDSVTGRVRITTHVETIEQIARAALESEDVEVTRVTKNEPILGKAPEIKIEGDLTIIPIIEEVMFVETRLVLKEELHIWKRLKTQNVEAPVALRKQTATIERFEAQEPEPGG